MRKNYDGVNKKEKTKLSNNTFNNIEYQFNNIAHLTVTNVFLVTLPPFKFSRLKASMLSEVTFMGRITSYRAFVLHEVTTTSLFMKRLSVSCGQTATMRKQSTSHL